MFLLHVRYTAPDTKSKKKMVQDCETATPALPQGAAASSICVLGREWSLKVKKMVGSSETFKVRSRRRYSWLQHGIQVAMAITVRFLRIIVFPGSFPGSILAKRKFVRHHWLFQSERAQLVIVKRNRENKNRPRFPPARTPSLL